MLSTARKVQKFVRNTFKPHCFGFVQPHSYLTEAQLQSLQVVLGTSRTEENAALVQRYEQQFAQLIGQGSGVSFAAARMAFYAYMKVLGIGEGDEVILPGFTCAVMPNAILRTGATPVYADIDASTFGSSSSGIEKVLSKKTKLIVAQHSFGIPCEIAEIAELGKKFGIPVLEDAAITLDSSLNGVTVGNWGDAAIFSTDHSKPLNTLLGGFFYSKNPELTEKLRTFAKNLPQLDGAHQQALYTQILFERKNYQPQHLPRLSLTQRWHQVGGAFLEHDYSTPAKPTPYPYPAKFPAMLAQLGLFELERWAEKKLQRRNNLANLLNIFASSSYREFLPAAYFDSSRSITPHRFAFTAPDKKHLNAELAHYIDVDWSWFELPVICAVDGLESLGYSLGTCPIAEKVCSKIINLPSALDEVWHEVLEQHLRRNCL